VVARIVEPQLTTGTWSSSALAMTEVYVNMNLSTHEPYDSRFLKTLFALVSGTNLFACTSDG
jgi:hypothetical protein